MTTRTDKDMEASGQWAKFGKSGGNAAWKHAAGVMVTYDCNAWGWRVDTLPGRLFSRLYVARFEAERGGTVVMASDHFTKAELTDLLSEYLTPAGIEKVLESTGWWWGVDSRDMGRLVIYTDLFERLPGRRR